MIQLQLKELFLITKEMRMIGKPFFTSDSYGISQFSPLHIFSYGI